MRGRIWLIYVIPIIALIVWQIIILQNSKAAETQWVVSADGAEFGQCAEAININGFDVDTDIPLEESTISPQDSLNAARDVLSDSPKFNYGQPAEITLPNGERKAVWAFVFVMDDGGASLLGPGNVVYVDAVTGEPLVLVTDVIVGDPYFAGCQLMLTAGVDDFFEKWKPGIYLMAYALAMLGAIGFVWLLNWFRDRRAAKSGA